MPAKAYYINLIEFGMQNMNLLDRDANVISAFLLHIFMAQNV